MKLTPEEAEAALLEEPHAAEPTSPETEIAALGACVEALSSCDASARARMLDWLVARFGRAV